jgi:hypothetical protein
MDSGTTNNKDMTILYNTDTSEIIGHFDPCYMVDGNPQAVELPIVELPYTTTTPPEINQETHYLTSRYEVDIELLQYRQVWEIHEIVVAVPSATVGDVIKLLIKKTVDGIALTEEEIQTLKAYNDEANIG